MATLNTQQKLNTGNSIREPPPHLLRFRLLLTPWNAAAVGFGTWQDKDEQTEAVYEAIKAGYRHIDTARVYGTEPAVAAGIKKSGIPRSEIFITTKLWNNSHKADAVQKALDASLKDLDTDYVDLYLMHWPSAFKTGDSLFPKDANGKNITEDVDYVEVCRSSSGHEV